MGGSLDPSRCGNEEHTHEGGLPAVSRSSVEECVMLPKMTLRLDNNNELTQTSNTQRTESAGGGMETFREDIGGGFSDSGSDDNKDVEPKPQGVTERRRAQNAKFSSWLVINTSNSTTRLLKRSHRLSTRAERVTKEEVRAAAASADDDQLSIRNLMSKQESTVIITDPREYQVELFEKAKKQNIIAVLDTGMQAQTFLVYLELTWSRLGEDVDRRAAVEVCARSRAGGSSTGEEAAHCILSCTNASDPS